jgi:SP family general alpha glucoside:H+ symporter-like MFS transporter
MIDAITGLATSAVGPYLLNPGAANAGGKMEFLYGGISIFSLTWCIFRMPETKGRTYEELDILFERRVPARAFAKYVIEDHDDESHVV